MMLEYHAVFLFVYQFLGREAAQLLQTAQNATKHQAMVAQNLWNKGVMVRFLH